MRNNYKTKQKEKILNIIKKYKKEFTIKELYKDLNYEVGLTTIYRYIEILLKENKVKQFSHNNNKIYYQYLNSSSYNNNFYLKCSNCSKLININCNYISKLKNHIFENHQFNTLNDDIIINGICFECSKGD